MDFHNPVHVVLVDVSLGTSWQSGLGVHSGGTQTHMQGIVGVGVVPRIFHRDVVAVVVSLPAIGRVVFFGWF